MNNEFFSKTKGWISFIDWWEKSIIMTSTDGDTMSRKKLILEITNKDGGAHVDINGPTGVFEKFRDKISGKMSVKKNTRGGYDINNEFATPDEFLNKPIWTSIRQTAHEAHQTLDKHSLIII